MLSHKRPGLTRAKVFLITAGALAVVLLAVAIVESLSYSRLLSQGAIDTLDSLSYADRFTSSKKASSGQNTLADVESDSSPSVGSDRAPIRAVEFVDFSCPYSKDENSVIREIVSAHPDLIRLTVRNFPLDDLHPDSRRAALAASCAGDQGKYWAMHDALFTNQNADGSFSDADLRRYALGAGAESAEYDACMKSGGNAERIQADIDAGKAAGVIGTPTFFVNGYKIDGAIPADIWQKILKLTK